MYISILFYIYATFNDNALLKLFWHSSHVNVALECVFLKWHVKECLFLHIRLHSGHSYLDWLWKRLKCCFRLSSSLSQLSQPSRGHFMRGPLDSKCSRTCFSKACLSRISFAHTWQIFDALVCLDFICICRIYSLAKLKRKEKMISLHLRNTMY